MCVDLGMGLAFPGLERDVRAVVNKKASVIPAPSVQFLGESLDVLGYSQGLHNAIMALRSDQEVKRRRILQSGVDWLESKPSLAAAKAAAVPEPWG